MPRDRDRNAPPTPFGAARAEAIWSQRELEHDLDGSGMTDGEHNYVRAVWAAMPGHTSWMDAFWRVMRGQVPA